MAKLKPIATADDEPIELTVELPAASSSRELHIPEALGRETGSGPRRSKLIAPILARRPACQPLLQRTNRLPVSP